MYVGQKPSRICMRLSLFNHAKRDDALELNIFRTGCKIGVENVRGGNAIEKWSRKNNTKKYNQPPQNAFDLIKLKCLPHHRKYR